MKSMSTIRKHSASDQRGMVSFLVTFIMLLVISLIIVGFTRVASQNRREALDRQLSTQAFYAAESGVNAFLQAAKSNASLLTTNKDTCGSGGAPSAYEKSLSADPEVKITCVLIDPTVPYLEETGLKTGSSHVFTIDPRNPGTGAPTALTRLVLLWSSRETGENNKGGCPNSASNFPAQYTNCDYGMLRLDLTKEPGGALNADTLAANTKGLTMQPSENTRTDATTNYSAGARAYRGLGRCFNNATMIHGVTVPQDYCAAVINVSPADVAKYYLRVSTLYNDADNLRVYAIGDTGQLDFAGAQVLIDSTGKAAEVLRRVQVRVPLDKTSGDGVLPFAAYAEDGVCKRFTTAGATFEDACSLVPGADSDASYTPCGGNCGPGTGPGGGTPTEPYWYSAWFVVTSNNDVSRITDCTWSWGDGTSTSFSGADVGQCAKGARVKHDFRIIPPKGSCHQITIKFTVRVTGSNPQPFEQDYWLPFSSRVNPWCPR